MRRPGIIGLVGGRKRQGGTESDLISESESFLSGSWAIELHSGGRSVPTWAWISGLAHAPADVLATWATDRESAAAARGTVDRWRLALSLAARELMVSATIAGDPVDTAQRLVFGRLEQQGVVADSPNELVRLTLRALGEYRWAARTAVQAPAPRRRRQAA